MSVVSRGRRIAIAYRATTSEGEMIACQGADRPLEFVVGSGEVISGLSRAVLGMHLGEERRAILSPEEAYGPSRSPVLRRVRRDQLPREVQVGDALRLVMGATSATLWVIALDSGEAQLSTEHPLAGKTVVVDLSVTGILDAA